MKSALDAQSQACSGLALFLDHAGG